MRFISSSLCLSFFNFLLITFLLASALQAEASSHAVVFVVDFSESMKEKIDDKSKEEIVREIFDGILDEVRQPLDAELIFFGHRDKDSCDDAEVVVPSKEFNAKTVRQKLSETSPKGRGGMISAVKKALEMLNDNTDLLSIVIFSDGEGTCGGDLMKTAREIKEKYDYRLTFHVIGLNPERKDAMNFGIFRNIGSYYLISITPDISKQFPMLPPMRNNGRMRNIVKNIANRINDPEVHHPKVIGKDEMVLIPAGEFFMGSDDPAFTDPNIRPRRLVSLDSFSIDKYLVTEQQYRSVMGENPSDWIGNDLPVHNVSWYDAKKYCESVGKRLPTEAEWEKAAKGGRNDKWSGTSDVGSLGEYAWIDDSAVPLEKRSGSRPHPVGTKNPNGYGIYDMSGNLLEWVSDWYGFDYYKTSPKANPPGPEKGHVRVLRGGSWDSHVMEVQTTSRHARQPGTKDSMVGFRCARSAE
ncbi:MAG: SUMF1/EgtB/PvdO family nonheme iron enzyme [Thermodesulfovibrionales bacterium]